MKHPAYRTATARSMAVAVMKSEQYLTVIVVAFIVAIAAIAIAGKPVPDSLESALILIAGLIAGIPVGIKAERERTRNGNGGPTDGK